MTVWRARTIAVVIALLSFSALDYFFLLPYGTLALERPVDWILLVLFLGTALTVVQLLEHARREADAARAARVRESIVASISHDLRTPLTTIKAFAQDVAAAGDERGQAIVEETDRLTSLVTDLLDFSRLNSGMVSMTVEPNEAEDLLGVALQQVSGVAGNRTISVTLDQDEPLLFARFDFTQTLRVLVNLIDNALKYSPPSESVDLAVKREGGWLTFSVSDRGAGIAAAEADRVFEPFYRPPGVAADVRGVGLGLSIARGLAEAQGGTLTYTPRSGGGSVFALRLPAVDVRDVT